MAQLTVPIVFDHDDLQRMVDEKIAEVKAQFIPKDQYEQRLKADMVAMLTEIQLEIEEIPNTYEHKPIGTYDYCLGAEHERKVNLDIIQQKINALKADRSVEDGKN